MAAADRIAEHLRRGELLDLAPELPLGSLVDEKMMMSWDSTHSIDADHIRDLVRGRTVPTQSRADYACAVRASTVDQALYITLKTVEGHLARVYGKLKISSRGELARGLGDERTRVPTL
jgi:hypothetical protein